MSKQYEITGEFNRSADGANIWDYLPMDAPHLQFETKEQAIAWAKAYSVGPDEDGLDVIWGAAQAS